MHAKPAVLVTGAATGLGAAYADRFARRGHDLVLVAQDRPGIEGLAARLRREAGVAVDILPADLTAPSGLAAVEARLRDDPRIGVLVNVADGPVGGNGEGVAALVSRTTAALTRLAAAVAPRLVRQGTGAILNVGAATGPGPGAIGGIVLFVTEGLQLALAPKGIQVQAVLHPAGGPDRRDAAVDALVDAALAGFDRDAAAAVPSLPAVEGQAHAAERYRGAA